MTDTDTPPVPVTPWYKSQILQGLIVAVVAQLLAHLGLAKIITSDQAVQIVNWGLQGLSALAAAYAARARVVGPVHPIAGTKTAQAAIAAATPDKMASNAPLIQPPPESTP